MSSGTIAAVIVLAVIAGGAYYAYQAGYLTDLDSLYSSIPSAGVPEEAGEVVDEGESETGESSLSIVTNNVNVDYPTLFPNPRWNHMPIKYYMDTGSGDGLTGFDEEDPDYVRQAMRIWEDKTAGKISFQEVSTKEDGEVIISWFPSLTEISGGRVVGEGGPTIAVQTGGIFTLLEGGEIFLLPTDNVCVGVNRPVHEMGHVLGLSHAPPGHGDIMYSREISCKQNITQITIDAITELYRTPAAPDLILTNVSVLKRGSLVDINFTVRNVGLKDSVQASVGFLGDGETIASLSVPSFSVVPRLSPGSGITNRITNAKVNNGISSLVLEVDNQDTIDEMNEGNNIASVSFKTE